MAGPTPSPYRTSCTTSNCATTTALQLTAQGLQIIHLDAAEMTSAQELYNERRDRLSLPDCSAFVCSQRDRPPAPHRRSRVARTRRSGRHDPSRGPVATGSTARYRQCRPERTARRARERWPLTGGRGLPRNEVDAPPATMAPVSISNQLRPVESTDALRRKFILNGLTRHRATGCAKTLPEPPQAGPTGGAHDGPSKPLGGSPLASEAASLPSTLPYLIRFMHSCPD